MKYYLLRSSSDPKVIGVKQGEAQAEIVRKKFLNQKHYEHYINFAFPQVGRREVWKRYGTFPEHSINLEYVEMRDEAISTDFLSYADHLRGGGEFILSEKAAKLIAQFVLPTYKLYPVNLFQNEQNISGYSLFYCPVLQYDVVDFSESVFFRGSPILGKQKFTLGSEEVFIEEKVKSPLFQCDQLVFTSRFDERLDLFNTALSMNMYVSERLAWAIEEAKLTGVNILEPQDPVLSFPAIEEENL